MRFVCDSCRAQYMISDDKVGARGVKVRCKKCGHSIQVRREEPAAPVLHPVPAPAPASEPTTPAPAAAEQGAGASIGGDFLNDLDDDELGNVFDQVLGGAAAPAREEPKAPEPPPEPAPEPARHDWFVAIDEQQVGPLSLDALRERWEKGEVGADSLCWREGFADWVPLSEVAELAPVLAPRPAGAAPIVGPAGDDLSISISSPVLTPEPAPAFKPSAASLLASLVQEEHAALEKPKPAPRPAAPAPGLLDVPLADPTAPTVPAVPVLQPVPHPAAFATGQHTPSPAGPYAPPVAPYAPSAYAPPAPPRRRTGMVVGLVVGGLGLIAGAVGVTYVVAQKQEAPAAAQPAPLAAAPVAPTPTAPAQPAVAQPTPQQVAAQTPPPASAPAPQQQVAAAAPAPTPAAAAPSTPEPEQRKEEVASSSTSRRRTSRTREREEAPPPPAPRPQPQPQVRQASARVPDTGDDDFDSLFGTKKASAPAPAERKSSTTYVPPAPGSATLPERLTQSDIMQVVLANRPAIMKCVEEQKKRDPGASGRLVMRWSIGTNGRTKGVSCQTDAFRSSYMAGCLNGLIKGMTFPRHQEQGDPIDFPFTF